MATATGILTRSSDSGPEVLLVRLLPDAFGGGRYRLPTRSVEWGEDPRDTVVQAFVTQTGLSVDVSSAYDVHADSADPERLTVGTWFRVSSTGGDPTPGSSADEVGFFPLTSPPDLAYPTDGLVLRRLFRELAGTEDTSSPAPDLSARLARRKDRYRDLLDAYTNELMRGAWISDLQLKLSQQTSAAAIASLTASHLAGRVEVDACRIWHVGPPDRCQGCTWRRSCSRDRCLHLVASASEAEDPDADEPHPRVEVSEEDERIPLNPGIPAADVALKGSPQRAELPGAGAQPHRFEGFPLAMGEEVPGVIGLISTAPMESNARNLFEIISQHVGVLSANARLVETLEQANEVKLGFIARMSHELKTPLTAILGYSVLLREELLAEGHEMGADGAATIEESGRNLLDIVESILEIAKLQSGTVRFRPASMNLLEALEERVLTHSKGATEKGLKLAVTPPAEGSDLTVWADKRRMRQVIDHIVGNAIKFTAEGSVDILLHPEEEMVTCEVRDTGIGIAPEFHRSIFNSFQQVSEKIHLDYGGLGIGLALARILVEQQGGKIWLESQPEKGSRFFFSLPRHASQHQRTTTGRIGRSP
jgi:signal transduction histidine kinase/ADP-ribose pyrophosphatase YjhB (NUDIX family)